MNEINQERFRKYTPHIKTLALISATIGLFVFGAPKCCNAVGRVFGEANERLEKRNDLAFDGWKKLYPDSGVSREEWEAMRQTLTLPEHR